MTASENESALDWLTSTESLQAGVIVVSIGANLGSDKEILGRYRSVIASLSKLWGGARISKVYRTTPVGEVLDQPDFLNAVVAWKPSFPIDPVTILLTLHEKEEEHGRIRDIVGASRTLDLDLLLVGDEKRNLAKLNIPHPRIQNRAFVLRPLLDLFGRNFTWIGQDIPIGRLLSIPTINQQECHDIETNVLL